MLRFLVSLSLLLAAASAAGQAPALIPVQGVLTDEAGVPLEGDVALVARLFDLDAAGTMLFEEAQTTQAERGFFTLYLGDVAELSLDLFRDRGVVWLELEVEGEVQTPRVQLGSVPYAAYAEHAGGVPWSNVSGRVQGMCPGEQVAIGVDADGSLLCQDAVRGVTAGAGLSGGGTAGTVALAVDPEQVQSRVSGSCTGLRAISAVAADGTVSCRQFGDIAGVAAGPGLAGGGPAGQVTLQLADDGVGAAQIAEDAVGLSEMRVPFDDSNSPVTSSALAVGDNFVIVPFSSVTPDSDGVCVVAAHAHLANLDAGDQGDYATLSAAYRIDGGSALAAGPLVRLTAIDSPNGSSPTATVLALVPVSGGADYDFGCRVRLASGVTANRLVGDVASCAVQVHCLGR